jgi:hypothetical protein
LIFREMRSFQCSFSLTVIAMMCIPHKIHVPVAGIDKGVVHRLPAGGVSHKPVTASQGGVLAQRAKQQPAGHRAGGP